MLSELFGLLTLYSKTADWIREDTWQCIDSIVTEKFLQPNVFIYLENEHFTNVKFKAPVYTFNQLSRHLYPREADALISMNSVNYSLVPSIIGKTIIVTKSMVGVDSLWTKLRSLDVIVIIQEEDNSTYSEWYPYDQHTCTSKPKMVKEQTCIQGKLIRSKRVFDSKIPKNFALCPFWVSTVECVPLSVKINTSGVEGMENYMLQILRKSLNLNMHMVEVQYDPNDYFTASPKTGMSGMEELMVNREADLAAGCLMITGERYKNAGTLPVYHIYNLGLTVPTPSPKALISGLYSGFRTSVWMLIGLALTCFSITISIGQYNIFHWSESLTFGVNAMLGLSYNQRILRRPFVQYLYIVFQFYSLHIVWFYQATLLINLFKLPYDKPYITLEDVADSDLVVLISPAYLPFIQNSNRPAWKKIMLPERHSEQFARDDIPERLKGKDHQIAYFDFKMSAEQRVKSKNPVISLKSKIRFLDETFDLVYVTFFMPKNHPLLPVLSEKLQRIIESGVLYAWRSEHEGYLRQGSSEETFRKKPINLEHLQSAFYAYFGLLVTSVIIFTLEISIGL